MKALAVALIFWLSIWTAPKGAHWTLRLVIIGWGICLCQQLLKDNKS